jgi:hypothetical protein
MTPALPRALRAASAPGGFAPPSAGFAWPGRGEA